MCPVISSCVQCSEVDSTSVLGNLSGARTVQLSVCCSGLLLMNDNRRLLFQKDRSLILTSALQTDKYGGRSLLFSE